MSVTVRPYIRPHIRFGKSIDDNLWMDTVEQVYNSGYYFPPGPFANDAAAAIGMVPLFAEYYTAAGDVKVRLT